MYEKEKNSLLCSVDFDGCFLAGGALTSVFTNQPIKDYDLYFKSREAFIQAVYDAYANCLFCVNVSKRAVTFIMGEDVYQLMYFDWFPTAEDVFRNFDFTINMAALDCDSEEFVFHDEFLKHNSQRLLKFNPNTKFPLASAMRVLKYQQRGYTIGKGEMLKIALAGRIPAITSWEDLCDQIGGFYGDQVLLGTGSREFSLESAMEILDQHIAFSEFKPQHGPRSATSLLRELGFMNGTTKEANESGSGTNGNSQAGGLFGLLDRGLSFGSS